MCVCAGLVSEQKNQMEEKARSGDGHGQEEAGLGDGETEGQLGQRGRRRRLQQTSGPELGRREDHTAAEETQTGLRAAAAHVRERQLLIHTFFSLPFFFFSWVEMRRTLGIRRFWWFSPIFFFFFAR